MTAENFSKKAKRGRPRSSQRLFAETNLMAEGVPRTQTHAGYAFLLFKTVAMADEETQRSIWECTRAEIRNGKAELPKGWKSAATEAGRFMAATNADADLVLQAVADARKRGIPFSTIAAHYRSLRLGERQGSTEALTKLLSRTLEAYRKSFPKTSDRQVATAALNLWNACEEEAER